MRIHPILKTLRRRFWQRRRKRWGILAVVVLVLLVSILLSRPEPPPLQPENLCSIFEEKPHWYRSSRRAAKKWGVPEAVQMAVLHQESSFLARARPPRTKILWILPGPRPSTAYGYAQVLDATWNQFRAEVERPKARRDRFDDVAYFVGWYGREIHHITGLAKDDAYGLYLAYHEGPGGFLQGSHRGKGWLLGVARKVEARAERYQRQLDGCRDELRGPFPWLWVLLLLVVGGGLAWWYQRRRPRPQRRRKARR